ncbi:Ribosome biogenesis protein Noc4 [Rasamsonia emersonii CBS 393.64]|uniref:Ribosome biogenesis protein Noc4 n=1 Tax=Rasamsonia emersonii (strain ATCC 16479 / CBS 393.64 / IMI 116815) TaxID=1408163 RepID=A0A0F4Z175_RASE3|nr:Ribosome biogenesis protein Noc4 [Rasamsonia emersonii CBS 393.64]KKA23846.1 Ribosome biogenesis protein Noc4 [Rasamsonia emersonii CBS 393.64]
MLNVGDSSRQPNLAVAVSLCRVFCRLIAGGNLKEPNRATEQEKIIVAWLKERCQEYQKALLDIIREADPSSQITAFTLCMRIVSARAMHLPGSETQVWSTGFFKGVFEALIETEDGDSLRSEFVEKYVKEYEDVRYYTFQQISTYAAGERPSQVLDRLISILSQCDSVPRPDHEFTNFYIKQEKKETGQKNPLLSVNAHKKRAQDAWLAVLRNNLSETQRKSLLRIMSHTIAPWFNRPELLMDFLTDSYNVGGSTSLLALSGLFYLIQEKNLDYPQFYTKLYSLLDSDLLHSKHRSRFFRLMNTFLASTHLPATLVASFIKRLSRLALNAPPTAIVAIVPFIYNLFKNHPTCTFMLHRVVRDEEWKAELEAEGMDDPFDPDEPDPTLTDAIESSLWEIETLQSHYHPNVAAIARIISEQFTKPMYNLEDFLDYTYQGMLLAELGVEEKPTFKKAPVVEFHIPKRIFTDRLLEEDNGVDTAPGSLVRKLWDFPSAPAS